MRLDFGQRFAFQSNALYKTRVGWGTYKTIGFALGLLIGLNGYAQLSESEYQSVGNRLQRLYEPRALADHYMLLLKLDWEGNQTAYANNVEPYRQYEVSVSGLHAKNPGLTSDAFSLIICHEFGHLFGGAPYTEMYLGSNEGQADYYATLKCFKQLVAQDNNASVVRSLGPKVTPTMRALCNQVYRNGSGDFYICLRGMFASYNLIHSKNPTTPLSLTQHDPAEPYMWPYFDHPEPQCRLDTLIAGLLCPNSGKLSNTDYRVGTCTADQGYKMGLRPRCWFNPETNSYKISP